MGGYSGREGIRELTYRLDGDMPIFRSVTSWRHGEESFLRGLKEQAGDMHPASMNGFVHRWTFTTLTPFVTR